MSSKQQSVLVNQDGRGSSNFKLRKLKSNVALYLFM